MNRKALNAAKRGAAFLDTKYKNWRTKIDPDRLKMSRGSFAEASEDEIEDCGCVLAQIDSAYSRRRRGYFSERLTELDLDLAQARRLGFLHDEEAYTYADLDEAWKRVLA